jgi:hypothetical protein
MGGKGLGIAAGGCRDLGQAGWQYDKKRTTNWAGAPVGNPGP